MPAESLTKILKSKHFNQITKDKFQISINIQYSNLEITVLTEIPQNVGRLSFLKLSFIWFLIFDIYAKQVSTPKTQTSVLFFQNRVQVYYIVF